MPWGVFFRIRVEFYVFYKIFSTHNKTMNLLKYLKETKAELKDVTFPSTSQTVIYTVMVITISVAVALMLSGMDLGLREALSRLLNR
jgi:preprotein translocase SecE subunit